MSKTFTVIFFRDSTHELLEKDTGLRVLIGPDTDVVSVYNATSHSDAMAAIAAFGNGNVLHSTNNITPRGEE